MSLAKQLLHAYPRKVDVDADVLAATIDALSDCAEACTADADANLGERNVAEMVRCIRLCLDCADVCGATVWSRVARPSLTLGSLGPCSRPARPFARAVARSASGTRRRTSTEGLRGGVPARRAGLSGALGRHALGRARRPRAR
jgi:hypothetical protein